MPTKDAAIRFIRPWQGRPVGHVDRLLTPGIKQTLVERHFAVFVEDEKPTPKRAKKSKASDEPDDTQ